MAKKLKRQAMVLEFTRPYWKEIKDKKIQIRFIGDASINHGNSYCQKKWDSMSKQSKECYYQNINPGDTPLPSHSVKYPNTFILSCL